MKQRLLITVPLLVLISGCAHFNQQPSHNSCMVEYSQNSVRELFIAQRHNPHASQENHDKVITGMDGVRAQRVMEEFRGRQPDTGALNENIELDMDTSE